MTGEILPDQCCQYLEELETELKKIGVGKIATIAGRYYAMDRDQRWERVEKAYRALVEGEGETATSALAAINASYAKGETDEFAPADRAPGKRANQSPPFNRGDGVIFFNFRLTARVN